MPYNPPWPISPDALHNIQLKCYYTEDSAPQGYYRDIPMIRNPQCWLAGVDFSCVCCTWNCCLVTPRHIIGAAHAPVLPRDGAYMRFVTADGTETIRHVVDSRYHPGWLDNNMQFRPDIYVSQLDSDVDPGIKFAKILPKNWKQYLDPGIMELKRVPFVCMNQDRNLTIRDISNWYPKSEEEAIAFHIISNGQPVPYALCVYTQPTNSKRMELYQNLRMYDSSSPVFMICDNEPILINTISGGGGGGGIAVSAFQDDLNQLIAEMGSNYTLTEFNLNRIVSSDEKRSSEIPLQIRSRPKAII
jgi:hypothetical protein